MNLNRFSNFILSDKWADKIQRHVTLWICFCIYFFIVNFFPQSTDDLVNAKPYLLAFQKMIYIPVSIFSAYVSGYFLLPRFILKGRYTGFFVLMLFLCSINLVSAWLLTKLFVAETSPLSFSKMPMAIRIAQPIIYGIGLGLAASGFAIIVKLLKYRYLKQKENETLQRQKINTELRLIKTNFHPHFLSDALKNIANLIRKDSSQSPKVILRLSELLSYILYESEKESVSVTQEIKMIREYVELEKVFHAERIIVHLEESNNTDDIKIAPLILLSLIQNTCEQLLISLHQKLLLNIKINAQNKQLFFEMHCNGYHDTINGLSNPASALSNALRRIEVLYGKENMNTSFQNDFFSIALVIKPEVALISYDAGPVVKSLYETA